MLFALLLAPADLVFVKVLMCDMFGSFSVATAPGAVTTKARNGTIASGAGSRMRPTASLGTATLTLSLPLKSTPFCADN